MFPTDQQKRLQAVSNLNPSLRAVAAPLQGSSANLQGSSVIQPSFSLQPQGNANFAQNVQLGPVQVAHPGPLAIQTRPNAPPVFIPQTKGIAGAPDMTPAPSFVQQLIKPFTDIGSQIGKQFNYLSGPNRTQQGLPGGDQITQAQQTSRNPIYASLINSYKGKTSVQGLLNAQQMAARGAHPTDIKSYLDQDAAAVDAQNKKAAGDLAQVAGYAVGGGGFGRGVVKAVTSNAIAGGIGTAGSTLANNPKASGKQLLKSAAEGGGSGAVLGGVTHGAISAVKAGVNKLFTPAEEAVLRDAGIGTDEAAVRGEQPTEPRAVPETAPIEPTETPQASPKKGASRVKADVPLVSKSPAQALAKTGRSVAPAPATPTTAFTKQELAFLKKNNITPDLSQKAEVADQDGNITPAITPQEKVAQAVEAQAPTDTAPAGAPPPEQQQVAQEAIAQQAARTPQATSVENSPTGVADAINANADAKTPGKAVQMLGSKETVVRKINTPSAHKLADTMKTVDREHQDLRADYNNSTPVTNSLSEDELNNLGRVVEHGEAPINARVAQAAAEWDANGGLPYHDFTAAGGKTGFIENHFPRQYNADVFKPGTTAYNEALQHLVDSGQSATRADAQAVLGRFKGGDTPRPGFFGNFDKARLDLGKNNYTYTHDALQKYRNGAALRTAQANHFGPAGETATDLLAGVQREAGRENAALAKKALERYIHAPDTTGSVLGKAGGTARAVFSALRLGKAVISHAGQTSNVALKARAQDLAVGWKQYLSRNPEYKAFVNSTDVKNPFNLHGLSEQTTGVGGKVGRVTAPLLTQMMKINRSVSALAANNYGKFLAKTGDIEKLRSFGVTGDIGKELTPRQAGQIARGLTNDTMFNPSRLATPIGAETTVGKTVGQYRLAYAYKQTGLLWDSVIKEAGRGNLAPLAKFLTISTPVAYGTLAAKNAISGKSITPTPASVATNVTGVPGELAGEAPYAKHDLVKTAASTTAPLAGEAVDLLERGQKALNGNFQPLEHYGAAAVPVAGTRIANKVAPNPAYSNNSGKKLKTGETEAVLKDGNGNPLLDKNGQPETVVIPKGVSGAAKDVLVQDATNNAVAKNIKATLTPNEKVLYDQPDARLKSMLDQKKIDEQTYNQIMAYKKVASNVTRAPAVLSPTLDANVKDYINQTAKLTDQGKLNWAKNAKGQALAQKVANELNGQLPDGIDKLPASPDLLAAYAKFDQARSAAAADKDPRKQWDEIVTRGKLRDFWKNAIEVSQPKETKEIYGLSMTQLQDYFLKNKKVTKAQLDAAVGLDDDLYAADLTDSLHFSKKFRRAFGYGDGPEAGDAGGVKGSYSKSGSGKLTKTGGVSTKVTNADGTTSTRSIDPNTGLTTNKSIGLDQLMPKNLSFKQPTIDTTPTKKTFKINLPSDVTGSPRPQRVVSLRAKRARLL